MESIKVEAQKRTEIGTKHSKALRKEGLVPCVMYSSKDSIHFAVTPKALKPLIYTPDFKVAEVSIDGENHRGIVKDVQFHPVSDAILHIDFVKLHDGVPLIVNIPLKTKGVSEGVKNGGKLIQQVRKIKVKALPEDLVSELYVDISALKLGNSVRVRDIEVNENMQILNPEATPVAMVEIPRALRSSTDAEAKAVGAADATADPADAEA